MSGLNLTSSMLLYSYALDFLRLGQKKLGTEKVTQDKLYLQFLGKI